MTWTRNLLLIFYVAGKSGAQEQNFTNLQKITHLWCIDFFTFLQKILHPLFFQSVETVGDLYMDVAEACAENGTKLYKMTSLGPFIVCLTIGGVCGLSTARSPDLEVWGSSLARSVVSLYKELYYTLSFLTLVYKWVPGTYYWGVPCDGLASRPGWGGSSNTPMHAIGIITFCLGLWFVCTRLYLAFTCESPVGIDRDASSSYCSGLNEAMVSIYWAGLLV